MADLRPCPFCNTKLEVAPDGVFEEACRCRVKSMTVEQWNNRPIKDALAAENERMREALKFYTDKRNFSTITGTSEKMRFMCFDFANDNAQSALSDKEVK